MDARMRMPPEVGESTGNATLLVLIDRSRAEHAAVAQTVLAALGHFGMPFCLRDVSRGGLPEIELHGHAAAILAQEHLGLGLSASDAKALLSAVEAGLGLVSFDHDLGAYPSALPDALGLAGAHRTGRFVAGGTDALGIRDARHTITSTQDTGGAHRFKQPVPVTLARVARAPATPLAELPAGAPALVATRVGRGRVVQWLVSPKLWLPQYFGHAAGLDDLFWKAIAWAARKPFAMKAMPPFVRLRFDDCTGLWRDRADLRFAEVLAELGHVPCLCVCMRAVSGEGAGTLHALAAAGRAEVAPHTLAPGVSLFFGDAGGAYSTDRLRDIFRESDDHLARWGVRPSKILSDHDHEWSAQAAPFLAARGIRFKMNITLPGERWTDPHVDWRPAPYGSMSYALDYLPGSRDFFAVFNHYTPAFDAARAYLADGRFLYHRPGGFGPYMWDFLNGLTTHEDAQAATDVESAAARLAAHTRLGLDSLFFGGSITHSHFARGLSEAEWRALIARYETLTARYAKRNVGYDHIADYARARADTHVAQVAWDARAGTMRCQLRGESAVALELYVFRDREDGVEHRFQAVPPFGGASEVAFGADA